MLPAARAERVLVLLGGVLLMAVGDLIMTLTWVTSVGMIEVNPLARWVMAAESPELLVAFRGGTLLIGLGIMLAFRHRRAAELAAWICFVAMTLLTFHWLAYSTTLATGSPEALLLAAASDPRFVVFAAP